MIALTVLMGSKNVVINVFIIKIIIINKLRWKGEMERQNSPSICSPPDHSVLTTLTTYSSSGERRSEAPRLLPHVAFSSPRGGTWSALGRSVGAFSSLGYRSAS